MPKINYNVFYFDEVSTGLANKGLKPLAHTSFEWKPPYIYTQSLLKKILNKQNYIPKINKNRITYLSLFWFLILINSQLKKH